MLLIIKKKKEKLLNLPIDYQSHMVLEEIKHKYVKGRDRRSIKKEENKIE